jgi:hypothetical protein
LDPRSILRLNLQGIGPMTFYFQIYLHVYNFDKQSAKCPQMRYVVADKLNFTTVHRLSSESLNYRGYSRQCNVHSNRSIFKINCRLGTEISRCPVGAKCHRRMPCILHYRQSPLLSTAFPVRSRREPAFALHDVSLPLYAEGPARPRRAIACPERAPIHCVPRARSIRRVPRVTPIRRVRGALSMLVVERFRMRARG